MSLHYVIAASQDDLPIAQQLWVALRERGLSVGLADATPGTALASKLIVLCSPSGHSSFTLAAFIARFLESRTHEDILIVGVQSDAPAIPQILRTTRNRQGFLEPVMPPTCLGAIDHSQTRIDRMADLIISDVDPAKLKRPLLPPLRYWSSSRQLLYAVLAVSFIGLASAGWLFNQLNATKQELVAANAFTSTVLTSLTEHLPDTAGHEAIQLLADDLMTRYVLTDASTLSDAEISRRAQLLHFVGEARDVNGNLEGAQSAFHQAFAYTNALLEREPRSLERLFDHSQSAFWLTNSAYRTGDLESAALYAGIYHQAAQELVRLDPQNMTYRAEAGHGAVNVGVIALERGEHDVASAQFEEAVATFLSGPLEAGHVDELDVGNVLAWKADTQLALGAIAAVAETRAREIALYETYLAANPANASASWSRAAAQLQLAYAHSVLGQSENAAIQLDSAIETAAVLFEANSDNDRFSRLYISALYERARLALWRDNITRAQLLLDEARRVAAVTSLGGESDGRYVEQASIHHLYADIALISGAYDTATAAALQAILIAERGIEAGFASAYPLHAAAHYVHGEALTASGQTEAAQRSFQAVIAAVEALSIEDRNLRLNDLLARSLWRQRDFERANVLRVELEQSGYARADFIAFWASSEPTRTVQSDQYSEG